MTNTELKNALNAVSNEEDIADVLLAATEQQVSELVDADELDEDWYARLNDLQEELAAELYFEFGTEVVA